LIHSPLEIQKKRQKKALDKDKKKTLRANSAKPTEKQKKNKKLDNENSIPDFSEESQEEGEEEQEEELVEKNETEGTPFKSPITK
jgi:hypothetical protein